jgi:putative ABC transport system permease protein
VIWATIVLSFRAIRRSPMRSILTTLGVVIGVASVIAMVTLGQGATQRVTSDISSLGNNLLIVIPGAQRRTSTSATRAFSLSDARAIEDEVPGLAAVAPSSGLGARVVYGSRNWSTGVTGATNEYFAVRNWDVVLGRTFLEGELRAGTPVCVLGETVRRELFGTGDPIGATVRVSHVSCEVIGVLESKGQSTFGEDQDDFMVMPLTAVQRRLIGSSSVGVIAVSARRAEDAREVQARIESLMRQRRRIAEDEEDDFAVRDLREISQVVGAVTGVLTALLGAIAAVSLLVGGIGIMNIMLVSVTERTREIGIRLAIGARAREILWQFLIEAIVLSTLGGIAGIALGLAGSWLAARGLGLPFVWVPEIVLAAFVFAAVVGVFFGWYPALRAARLNPIEALRHE